MRAQARAIRVALLVLAIGPHLATEEARAQTAPPKTPPGAAPAAAKPATPAIDPNAIAALEKMGAFLRGQNTLGLKLETTTDEVLESGQKIQLNATGDLRIRRPNRLRADVTSDRKTRQFFYDGRTFTIYAPREHYYGTLAAPPTVTELVETLAQRYNIELPLADLFYWGTDKSGIADITSALNVGPTTIGGVLCDHYALRQRDVDWQIWIQRGREPLPRKMVVTTTSEPSQPQHTVLIAWQLNPKLDEAVFSFVPPRDAVKIDVRVGGVPVLPRQGRAAPR